MNKARECARRRRQWQRRGARVVRGAKSGEAVHAPLWPDVPPAWFEKWLGAGCPMEV